MQDIDVFQHTRVARHIPHSMEISLDYFKRSGLACEYFLDINEVFLQPKWKNSKKRLPNPDHIYQVFGRYSHESPDVICMSIVDFITCDAESFKEKLVVVFTMLRLDLNSWLLKTKYPSSPADEASLYGLCQLYSGHALAYTTGSVWSTLELHGNFMVNDLKKHCDVHLVFLEGGILANIHQKPQIPRLMGIPLKTKLDRPPVLVISDLDNDNSGTLSTKAGNKPTNIGDHTYSSPKAHVVTSNEPIVSSATNLQGDHTYAEMSDVQSEPYSSSNSDQIVTTGGKLIISRSEQVEISVEYRCYIAFPEATMVTNEPDETENDVQDQVMTPDKINMANQGLLDETIQPNVQNKPLCSDATKGKEAHSELLEETSDSVSAVLPDETEPTKDIQSELPDGTNDCVNDMLLDEPQVSKYNQNVPPDETVA